MKRLVYLTIFILGLTLIYNTDTQAQDFKAGGGLAFGSEVEAIGIQATGVYNINEEFNGAADFIIFFPDNYDWWELNINGHYKFHSQDNVQVYGLAGLNFASWEVDTGVGSISDSEAGLNLGGGAEMGLDFANLYGEIKYILSDADQLVISAGLRFPF